MKLVYSGLLSLTLAQPAFAQTAEEQIITQLQGQGYTEFRIERTWLGRVRIEATDGDRDRELVFNPYTGEILRDRWYVEDDDDDEDEDDEDEDDDEEDDDDDEGEDDDDEEDDDDDEDDDDEDDEDDDD